MPQVALSHAEDQRLLQEIGLFDIDVDEVLNIFLWTELVKYRAGYRCERCGSDGSENKRSTVAHHRDHDGKNNTLRNGECLCDPCHSSHHHKGKKITDPKVLARMSEIAKERGLSAMGNKARWGNREDG